MLEQESNTINTVIKWMTKENPEQRATATDILRSINVLTSKGIDFTLNGSELESLKSVLAREIQKKNLENGKYLEIY